MKTLSRNNLSIRILSFVLSLSLFVGLSVFLAACGGGGSSGKARVECADQYGDPISCEGNAPHSYKREVSHYYLASTQNNSKGSIQMESRDSFWTLLDATGACVKKATLGSSTCKHSWSNPHIKIIVEVEDFQRDQFLVSILGTKNNENSISWVDVFPIISACHRKFPGTIYFMPCANGYHSTISGKMKYTRINNNKGFKLLGDLKHYRNGAKTYEMELMVNEGSLDEDEFNYIFKVEDEATLSGIMKVSSDKNGDNSNGNSDKSLIEGTSDGGWLQGL